MPLSRVREMTVATLITHAEGPAFDRLARHWAMPRPVWIQIAAWRGALKAACYGKRATGGMIFEFLEAALGQFATVLRVQMDPSYPTRLYSPDAAFVQAHVGRYVRVPGYGIFAIDGPQTVSDTDGEYVTLSPIRTRNYQAANWRILSETTEVRGATILPFVVHEPTPCSRMATSANGIKPGDPGVIRVFVYGTTETATPPTYIQWGESYAVTADGGADTLTTADAHELEDDDRIELAGAYMAMTAVAVGSNGAVLPQATINVADTSDFGATGTFQIESSTGIQNITYTGKTATTFTGCSGGTGIISTDDVVAGIGTLPGNLAIDTVYYAIVVSPTVMQVSATLGGGAINFTGSGTGPLVFLRARPADEPLGGHILSDVSVDGDQDIGPYPLYLPGPEIMSDLALVMREVVAAGVRVKFIQG